MSTTAYCMITGKVKVTIYLQTKINLYPTSHVYCPICLKFSSRDLNICRGAFKSFIKFGGQMFLISVNKIFTSTTSSVSPPHLLCSTYIPHLDKAWQHFLITVKKKKK
jgi:hypothetical protein